MGRVACFKPLDYRAWRETQLKELPPHEMVPCLDCRGTGETACDSCGHESECSECEGTGLMAWEDLTDVEKSIHLDRSGYIKALLDDARALAEWLGRDMCELLVASGFAPYSTVYEKRLTLNLEHMELGE